MVCVILVEGIISTADGRWVCAMMSFQNSKVMCLVLIGLFCSCLLCSDIKDISVFSFGGHFVQQSRTVCAILFEGIMTMSNISLALFRVLTSG